MTPKIVTRLANIAAKLAGSDKYDPTIEPVTAFEYYLDKGVDKILAIKGVPAAEVSDKGKVLSVSDSGAPVWENREPLVLEFATTDPYTVATPFADIKTAIDSGRQVYFDYNGYRMPFTRWSLDQGTIVAIDFAATSWYGGGIYELTGVAYSIEVGWSISMI